MAGTGVTPESKGPFKPSDKYDKSRTSKEKKDDRIRAESEVLGEKQGKKLEKEFRGD